MSAPATESSGGIVDAGTASAEDVRAALGVDPLGDDESDDGPDQVDGQPELTLEGLAAQVETLQLQNAELKRENAARRVEAKKKVSTTDSSDAVAVAVEAAKAEAKLEYGVKLAGSEVKAALASVMTDAQIAAFVDDLNLAKYVTEEGDPDVEAIAALKARQLALLGKRPAAKVGNGRTGAATSRSNADLFAEAFSKVLP